MKTRRSTSSTFPDWIYDNSRIDDPAMFRTKGGEMIGGGERAVRFLRALKHPKSTALGRAFQLDPWQERIVRRIYGPRHPDGSRIVKTVFLMLPRGNRKTSLSAALALLHTIGPEKVPGGEVISAASDQKQARIGFDEAANIIRAHKALKTATKIVDHRNRISYPDHGTFYEAISSDAGTQHGRSVQFLLADELHAWKKRDLWDVLRSSLPKSKGSLVVIATTAGRGQDNVAFELYDYARKVALGDIDDPAFLPILFEADRECDWRDEEIWRRVNPGMACGYPDLDGLRQLAREAENRPGDREAFRQLHLNIWLDHSTDPFVDMAIYDRGSKPIDLEKLKGSACWLGIDMSVVSDLTAVIAAFRDPDCEDGYIVLPHFFCPADNLRAKADKDGVPYPAWAKEGHITATPGNTIDYRAVERYIRGLDSTYDVREIAFDPAYASPVMGPLTDDGFLTGCRRAEIVGLTWQRVDFFGRTITVIGKGDKTRTIPMTQSVYDLLWQEKDHHATAVFTYVVRSTRKGTDLVRGERRPITMEGFKTAWRRFKSKDVVNFRFHDTRHTAATRTLRTGNLKIVQQMLGHEDVTTTAKYAHAMLDDMRAAMEAANPIQKPEHKEKKASK